MLQCQVENTICIKLSSTHSILNLDLTYAKHFYPVIATSSDPTQFCAHFITPNYHLPLYTQLPLFLSKLTNLTPITT